MVLEDCSNPNLFVHAREVFESSPQLAQLCIPGITGCSIHKTEAIKLYAHPLCGFEKRVSLGRIGSGDRCGNQWQCPASFLKSFRVGRQLIANMLRQDL